MTKLIDIRKIKTISLPSFPDVEIKLYDSLLAGDALTIQSLENDFERGIKTLTFFIKKWSFVDDKEKPLDITVENLNKLPMKDIEVLMNEIETSLKQEEGKKKKS